MAHGAWREFAEERPNGDLKTVFRADPLDGRSIRHVPDRPDLDGSTKATPRNPFDLRDEKAGFGFLVA